jgi:hypothetical protein
MRRLWLLAFLTLSLTLMLSGLARAQASGPIQKLKVVVKTMDDFGASTDEAVWFSLGPSYEWALATPGKVAFKNGASDTFNLPPQGLRIEDIKFIKLRKSHGDDWYLRGLEVWINGKPYYRNEEINLWMEGGQNEWTAPGFPAAARP